MSDNPDNGVQTTTEGVKVQESERAQGSPYLQARITDTQALERIHKKGLALAQGKSTEFELLTGQLSDDLKAYEDFKAEVDQKWGIQDQEQNNKDELEEAQTVSDSDGLSKDKNLDSDEARHIRGRRHFELEESVIPKTFGLSFKDRFIMIRTALFKGTEAEDKFVEGKILSDERAQVTDSFMPSNEVAELALEKYISLIDTWYEKIQNFLDSKELEDATFRMLSTVFVCGTLIHPSMDGNGQTFKALVLSYMHDLLPGYRDRFVPIKYSSTRHDVGHEMSIPFMGGGMYLSEENDLTAGAVPIIRPYNETDAKLVAALDRLKDVDYLEENSQRREEIEEAIMRQTAEELHMPDLLRSEVAGYEQKKKFFVIKKRVPKIGISLKSFRDTCSNYLNARGYPVEQVRATVNPSKGEKLDRASNAVRQLMNTGEGLTLLNGYVLTSNTHIASENQLQSELFHKAVRTFDRQKKIYLQL